MFFQSLLLFTILLNIFIIILSIKIILWLYAFIKWYIRKYSLKTHLCVLLLAIIFVPKLVKNIIAQSKEPKLLTHQISEVETMKIKDAYNVSKTCDIQKITEQFVYKIRASGSENIHSLAIELNKIQTCLLNPFFNHHDLAKLNSVRELLVYCFKSIDHEAFLHAIHEVEQSYIIAKKVHQNHINKKALKILIEEGPQEFSQFFEDLFYTENGRKNLKEYCDLKFTEIEHLKHLLDEPFSENMQSLLYTFSHREYACKKENEIKEYIKKKLCPARGSPDGKLMIIEHLKNWANIDRDYIEAVCNLVIQKRDFNPFGFDRQIKLLIEKTEQRVKKLIQL